ncbi:MAG: hypothetical protein M3275_00190 [Thermoproteota archaeon]|nr:hypothetical protein [Thermoproteota archaeon]
MSLLLVLFQQIATSSKIIPSSSSSVVSNALIYDQCNSTRVEGDCDVNTVVVTWREKNQTYDTSVARVSTDAGQTFGPVINLGDNGTITTSNTTAAPE